jgi:hypothetical protein
MFWDQIAGRDELCHLSLIQRGRIMTEKKNISVLTRTILTGVSAGTLVLTQVGCAPAYRVEASAGANPEEVQLCSRALDTRRAVDVETFIKSYPTSQCVAPLLNAVPKGTLGAVTQGALAGVPPEVLAQVEPDRIAILAGRLAATGTVAAATTHNNDSDY